MSESTLGVYVDREGSPVRVGTLLPRVRRDRQGASFVYEDSWLEDRQAFAIDPVYLPLARGAFHTPLGHALFPGIADSAPDRWGRALMTREARRHGPPRTLSEVDFLVRVDDVARQGALRFRYDDGPFVAGDQPSIPPLVRLGELLRASDDVERGDPSDETLRLLLAPGSSLGGARPKASVLDGARLCIAKFPSAQDRWRVTSWEAVALDLARDAGIDVPNSRSLEAEGRSVLIVERFDRRDGRRVPYLSGMAMLGAADREEGHSYLEIADVIRQQGVGVAGTLEQLWRRMVFNVLISNTDDHLRNHGFLREGVGWRLSPAFDLNPVPVEVRPRVHALALDESDPTASIDTVLATAAYVGLSASTARGVLGEVARSTARWRAVARKHGLRRDAVDQMASAFEHADASTARQMGP